MKIDPGVFHGKGASRLLAVLTAALLMACSPSIMGGIGKLESLSLNSPTILSVAEQSSSLSESPTITWAAPPNSPSDEALTYEYSVGVAPSDTSLREWITIGAASTVSVSGLSLNEGTTYYVNIRAVTPSGLRSEVASIAWLAQRTAPVALELTGPGTLFTGYCNGPYTIETRNSEGVAWAPSSDLSIDLSGANGIFFSDAGCSSPITSLTLPRNSSSMGVHYRVNVSGSSAVSVSSGSMSPSSLSLEVASKQERIDLFAGALSHLGYLDGGPSDARFHFPEPQSSPMLGVGSAVLLGDFFYLTDPANCVIRKINRITGLVSTFAGQAGVCQSTDGVGADARFHNPSGIATDGVATLYVADSGSHTIRAIDLSDISTTTLAGTAGAWGFVDDTGAAARFIYPSAIVHLAGFLYVTDVSNHAVRKVNLDTRQVTTLAGGNQGLADGEGVLAEFQYPMGIATDGTDLYVSDTSVSRIRRVTLAGVVTTVAGFAACDSTDAIGTAAGFCRPTAITIDGTHLYVADTGNNKIRKIALDTMTVTTFAGSGVTGSEDGVGTFATFNRPGGLISDDSAIFVIDSLNQGLRRIQLSDATVTRFVGIPPNTGLTNGAALSARFNSISGIVKVGTNLYVTEQGNHIIRRISLIDGQVSPFAGQAGTLGSADGIAAEATFNAPNGVATDGVHLYVADKGNHTIRKIVLATAEVTTIAGLALATGTTDGSGSAARFSWPHSPVLVGTQLFVAQSNRIRRVDINTGAVDTVVTGLATIGGMTSTGGNLYITEYSARHMIRRIQIDSWAQTALGGATTAGYADGTSPAVRFNEPRGITTDGMSLFAIDSKNNSIRQLALTNSAVTTYLGTPPIQADIDGALSQSHTESALSILSTDSGIFLGNATSLRWIH